MALAYGRDAAIASHNTGVLIYNRVGQHHLAYDKLAKRVRLPTYLQVLEEPVDLCLAGIQPADSSFYKVPEVVLAAALSGALAFTLAIALAGALARTRRYTGEIFLDEVEISKYKYGKFARKVGILSQNNASLYGFTVEEVVRLGRYASDIHLIHSAGIIEI